MLKINFIGKSAAKLRIGERSTTIPVGLGFYIRSGAHPNNMDEDMV